MEDEARALLGASSTSAGASHASTPGFRFDDQPPPWLRVAAEVTSPHREDVRACQARASAQATALAWLSLDRGTTHRTCMFGRHAARCCVARTWASAT